MTDDEYYGQTVANDIETKQKFSKFIINSKRDLIN
jgi:hypothetical protein